MPSPPPLEPSCTYHIYNRGNNGDDLFFEERNYAYFLKLYAQHIVPVIETFAYCLMRNHFHLLIRVKDGSRVGEASHAFGKLFQSYTQAINKAHGCTGSLFEHPFHRRLITTDVYFACALTYIHQNPQKHGFVQDFRDWPHSSYHVLVSDVRTRLMREEVMSRFGGCEAFVEAHKLPSREAWLDEQDFD